MTCVNCYLKSKQIMCSDNQESLTRSFLDLASKKRKRDNRICPSFATLLLYNCHYCLLTTTVVDETCLCIERTTPLVYTCLLIDIRNKD